MIEMPSEFNENVETVAVVETVAPKRKIGGKAKKSSVPVVPKETVPEPTPELIAESPTPSAPLVETLDESEEEMITITKAEYERLKAGGGVEVTRKPKLRESRKLKYNKTARSFATVKERLKTGTKYEAGVMLYALEMPKKGQTKREEVEAYKILKVNDKGVPTVLQNPETLTVVASKRGKFEMVRGLESYNYYLMEEIE